MRHALSLALLSLKHLSLGVWIIASMLVLSGIVLLTSVQRTSENLQMWVFSPEHRAMYTPMIEEFRTNSAGEQKDIDLSLLSIPAIKNRMMSGFFSGLPTADLIEVERATVGQVFMGPPEAIGFHDLTDRLKAEGLYEQINAPSLAP